MGGNENGGRHLADHALADEIVLYGDLMVAASESEHDLSLPEIDEVLGVSESDTPPQG